MKPTINEMTSASRKPARIFLSIAPSLMNYHNHTILLESIESFCRSIRSQPDGDQHLILVGTTSDRKEDLQKILDAGADDYIAKPYQADVLEVRLVIARQRVKNIETRTTSTLPKAFCLASPDRRPDSLPLNKRKTTASRRGLEIQAFSGNRRYAQDW